MNLIGLRIKNIRKEKQLTLKDVAQGIISVPYLANIENGIKVASMETLIHIAKRLEIPEEVLLMSEDEANKALLKELDEIFELLVFSNPIEMESRLKKIAEKVDLRFESPAIELSFYCLQMAFYYKTWEFSKAEEVEAKYLKGTEKRAADAFSRQLLSYYYYGQAVKHSHATCDYQLAVQYWEKCVDITENKDFHAVFHVCICINYICQSIYEPALGHIQQAWDLIKDEEQERFVSILYFYGYIYFQIGFMTEAKSRFEQTLHYFSKYPEAKKIYYFVVQLKMAEIENIEGNETLFQEKITNLYEELMAYETTNTSFNNNDYLVITELMVIFAEKGFVEEATSLMGLMNKVIERVKELNYFMEYTETLLLYHQDEQGSYEEKMLKLLKKIDASNDPVLIERVKKHASKHFAKSTKYKMAYDILS
ncbi:helix-turn-helix domain-containing protein [Listeria swaminathanii]|uniref:Helix-turn-helix transcriptional regulator n=1 Tax=Listeria swaminathanii TaxID=2713501 RepID=A0A7X1DNK4_9LIST|nr:helix-turn-helix transcriptional regulator [Listeria swaminathanii]MBC2330103.1 helix-turn-helix transcriptional regulator [Listeria swaminathanii]